MTQRYGFSTRIHGNWKLAVDSVCEWYHPPYVHGRFIDPDVAEGREDGAAGRRVPLRPLPAPHAHLGARARRRCAARAGDRGSRAARPAVGLQAVPGRPVRPRRRARHRRAARLPQQGRHRRRGATTSSGSSRTCRSRSGPGTTTSPTRTGRSRSTRTSTRSTSTSCRRPTRPTAWRRSSSSTARSSSPCRTSTRSRRRTPRWRPGRRQQFHLSDQELLIRNFHKRDPRHRRRPPARSGRAEGRPDDRTDHAARRLRRPRAVRRRLGPPDPPGALRHAPVEDHSRSWPSSTTPSPPGPRRRSTTSTARDLDVAPRGRRPAAPAPATR